MGYDSKGILVFNLKYEHAISFINLVKFINYYQMPRSISSKLFVIASGGGEANVYGSSYYWNFRTSFFKQVACLILAKNLFTGSLKNRSIDNLETQKKSISMKNSQFFDYLLYAKSKKTFNKIRIKKSLYETPDGIDWLNLSQSSRGTSQGTELVSLPMEKRRR